MSKGGACGKNCPWISISIAAGACMGTGAFIFASNFSDQGLFGTGLLGPAPCLILIVLRFVLELRYRLRTGRWTKTKNSRLLTDDGKIRWATLIPLVGNVITNGGYLLSMSLGWKFAKAAGINQGVISTLLSMASVFNIVIFYFKFGEKISCLHLIGVGMMIACVLCISLAAASKKEEDEDFDSDDTMGLSQGMAGTLAILCGLLSAILMSLKHLLIRLYKKTFSGVDQGIDSSILEFGLYCLLLIPLSNAEDFTLGWKEIGIGAGAGFLICTGRIFISIGVSIGLAAPA